MEALSFYAAGQVVQQGSKRIGRNRATGKPILIDDNDAALRPWRSYVTMKARQAANAAQFCRLEGPAVLVLTFLLARPKSHYGTGRNRGQLKPSAPTYPTVKPDLDKLIRAILDSLTDAKVYRDDAQVVHLNVAKRYATETRGPGVMITLKEGDA